MLDDHPHKNWSPHKCDNFLALYTSYPYKMESVYKDKAARKYILKMLNQASVQFYKI